MVDATGISGVLGTLKGALETGKALIAARDAAIVQTKAAELLGQITAAHELALRSQEREAALAQQVHELEGRIRQMEAWENEKSRYKLTKLTPGVMVYEVEEDARGDEPPHYICANCFQQQRKSFLNSDQPNMGRTKLHCPSCGWTDRIGHFQEPRVIR